jgi:hypothetical protein
MQFFAKRSSRLARLRQASSESVNLQSCSGLGIIIHAGDVGKPEVIDTLNVRLRWGSVNGSSTAFDGRCSEC